MPRKWLIAALCLPMAMIALGIVRAEYHLAHSTHWVFEVAGYDPRDLLRGQYIQYRLALHETQGAVRCDETKGERCCLCLTPTTAGAPPQVEKTTCQSAEARCSGVLQTRYLSELQRYYIPEARAEKLSERFRTAATAHEARLAVAIDASGKPQITGLLIDGHSVDEAR